MGESVVKKVVGVSDEVYAGREKYSAVLQLTIMPFHLPVSRRKGTKMKDKSKWLTSKYLTRTENKPETVNLKNGEVF